MIKVADHLSHCCKAYEFLTVDTIKVDENAGAIDDGDIVLGAEKNFIWISVLARAPSDDREKHRLEPKSPSGPPV